MLSGIYKITNIKTNEVYVGSAKSLSKRRITHFSILRHNHHHNPHLQASWDKYGEENFLFETLFYCSIEKLIYYEQIVIDYYKKKIGWDQMYNENPIAGSNLGYRHTEESKKKMSDSQKK